MGDSIQNVPKNLIVPFDFRKESVLSGTVTAIAFETIVSKMLRQLTGIQKKGWGELAFIHTIAQQESTIFPIRHELDRIPLS